MEEKAVRKSKEANLNSFATSEINRFSFSEIVLIRVEKRLVSFLGKSI